MRQNGGVCFGEVWIRDGGYLVKLLSSYIYNMKIVTWNIRHGGGKRVKDIVGMIGSYSEVDVFIITEFRNNNNDQKGARIDQKWLKKD